MRLALAVQKKRYLEKTNAALEKEINLFTGELRKEMSSRENGFL